jgi:hypothetical protein
MLERSFFALLSNPRQYDVEAASAALDVDTWRLPRGEVQPGDAEDVFASDWTQGAPSSQLVVPHLIAGPPFTVRIGFGLEL